MYQDARAAVEEAVAKFGADKEVALPHTAYSLPVIYGFTGT